MTYKQERTSLTFSIPLFELDEQLQFSSQNWFLTRDSWLSSLQTSFNTKSSWLDSTLLKNCALSSQSLSQNDSYSEDEYSQQEQSEFERPTNHWKLPQENSCFDNQDMFGCEK